MVKILCLSDIHYSAKKNHGVYTDDSSVDLRNDIGKNDFDILLSSIEKIGPIDLLVFCGDVIVGKDTDTQKKESLNEIRNFISRISSSNKIFRDDITNIWERIIYVPGNHDVDRNNCGQLLEGVSDLFIQALSPMYNNTRTHKYAPIFIFDNLKLIVSVISTVDNSCSINTNISNAIDKINKLSALNDEQKDEIIQLLKINSEYDVPSITWQTIEKFMKDNHQISEENKYNDYRKIMFSHHPLLGGIEPETSLKKYADTVGGYGLMKNAEGFGYRFFIHGHLHSASCLEITDQISENKKSVIQLGLPLMKMDSENCGCVLVEIDDDNNKFPFNCTLLRPDSISWKFKQTPLANYNDSSYDINSKDHILVDHEINELIKENVIVKNGDLSNVEAASYDCSLGNYYKKGPSRFCNWKEVEVSIIEHKSDGPGKIILEPNETILIFSHEEFNIPNDMVLHASPISSWLRKGIKFDISFFVDPGFFGRFSIPVTNESDKTITIDAQSPIISLEFIKLSRSCESGWCERHQKFANSRVNMEE